MAILGDLERLLADLYPYRVPLTAIGLLLVVLAGWFAVRRGWYADGLSWAGAHRVVAPVLGAVVLLVAVVGGNYLLSPLWERTTLDEASPLAVANATVAPTAAATTAAATSSATPGVEATAAATTSDAGFATPTSSDAAFAAPTSSDAVFTARVVSAGEFSGADDFHFGEGRAQIIEVAPDEYILRFEAFSVRNGPDLFVYLSSDGGEPSGDAVKLGALKATDGAFNYEIPPGIDVSGLGYAMIWCDQFAVLFATAPLSS
ncbi:MAG: DM13 domain-containing protein [Dehalococcoidia bacterium]|jgi:hypothetical protein|nr:DM13 domain-containing protein [Dehalococcoidia bacterium]